MRLKTLTVLVTLAFTSSTSAMTMQELFDSVNAMGNVNNPAVLQGQTMNLYTGGSLFMRTPRRTYNLASVTPPSWNAGCGGIDLFMGGFSYINKEQFVAMLRNIGSNALGYGFKLAIQNLCPTCDNVMQALQATAQQMNRQNIDSCEAAVGLVNASVPDTWTKARQNAAKNFGVDTNIFENITDAWTNVMNSESRTNETIQDVADARPEAKDKLPTGNIVWKALKKVDGLTDEHRMILMSMLGTVVFPTGDTPEDPKPFLPIEEINIAMLVGNKTDEPTIKFPIYKCTDGTAADQCLSLTEGESESTETFKTMVRKRMELIAQKIADRGEYSTAEFADIIHFVNSTDIPVYKILSVNTRYGSSDLAEAAINRYLELIAAKYAEVYIQLAVRDLRAALTKFATVADAAQAQSLDDLRPRLAQMTLEARQAVALAHSQTVSTYAIVQEVQHMERAMSANLSQTLRNSLAFGKSLR